MKNTQKKLVNLTKKLTGSYFILILFSIKKQPSACMKLMHKMRNFLLNNLRYRDIKQIMIYKDCNRIKGSFE